MQRPLALHVSALNDEEYAFFTSSLADILAPDTFDLEDVHYEKLSVSIREARAWLRGRYQDLSVSDLDQILRLFTPTASDNALTGNQFFALLRIVLHVRNGAEVDRNLVFSQVDLQTTPTSSRIRKASNEAPARLPPAPPIRIRQPSNGTTSDLPTSDMNPFHALSIDHPAPPLPPPRPSSDKPVVGHHASNPFVARSKTIHTSSASVSSPGVGRQPQDHKLPPLPPRKPPPVIPPRSSSISVAPHTPSKPPPPPVMPKVPHLTSALMKQSLQASKAAQDAKKAEEQRAQTLVLQVLKKSGPSPTNGSRAGSVSPTKNGRAISAPASTVSSDDRFIPALPPRRRLSPPPSSATSSTASFEQIAGAALPRAPSRSRSPIRSPSRPTTDLPLPPPLHPDRKTPGPGMGLPSDWPSSPSPRTTRSKSMHHPVPPPAPPPLRRPRPESVQLASPSTTTFPSSATSFPKLARHMSLSSAGSRERSRDREDRGRDGGGGQPLAQFQKTLSGLGPRLDAARYKAEAGLSRRGFINIPTSTGLWRTGEATDRLVTTPEPASASSSDGGLGVDLETESDEDERERERARERRGRGERDGMKWPAGEGWKPLG
ncbi:hypothetical protein OF83DRAFT_1157242 [Amylostereum chailletii]|nr:hypothetical protein OF83DRAFT_1157242 [Amylostereum chailletii]